MGIVATQLKNIVRFVAAAAGVPTSLPHNLNIDDLDVFPDLAIPSIGGFTITANATTITVTNLGTIAANVDVYVEHWHTVERAFDNVSTLVLAPQPLIPSYAGTPLIVHALGGAFHSADTYANLSTKVSDQTLAVLALVQAFTANQRGVPVALVDGANVAVNANLANNFTLSIAGVTAQLDNPTNLVAGMAFMFAVTQVAPGGRALTFGTAYSFGAAGTPNIATSTTGQIDIISCLALSTTKMACVASRGFS